MKPSRRKPEATSINISICGNRYRSFEHVLMRSMKSMHVHHFPDFFFTITTLDIHVGYFISCTNPSFNSFPTSSVTTFLFSSSFFHFLCIKTLDVGYIESWWHITLGSISGMSDGFHANRSTLSLSILMISASSTWDSPKPICVNWNSLAPICTFLTLWLGSSYHLWDLL